MSFRFASMWPFFELETSRCMRAFKRPVCSVLITGSKEVGFRWRAERSECNAR
jgi:hypothetical protein